MRYTQLIATALFWIAIVVIRGFMHVEPWEAGWFLWVLAHGVVAARFGYVLKEFNDNSSSGMES